MCQSQAQTKGRLAPVMQQPYKTCHTKFNSTLRKTTMKKTPVTWDMVQGNYEYPIFTEIHAKITEYETVSETSSQFLLSRRF